MADPSASLPLDHAAIVPARIRSLVSAGRSWSGPGRLPASRFDAHAHALLVGEGLVAVSNVRRSGRVVTVALLGPGDVWIGERGHGDDRAPAVRVDALCASTVALIARDAFTAAVTADVATATWLADIHLRRALDAERRAAEAYTLSVDERLRGVLRDLACARGTRLADGRVGVGVRVSQERLAWLAGTTRESVNRALQSLAHSGAVSLIGGRYVLAPPSSSAEEGAS
jgi:CRP/FNR family cyclic AMP-dependent transcriptional regulator